MLHRLSFQGKIWKSEENVKLCRHHIIPGVLFTLITASWNKILLNATLSVDYWRGVYYVLTGALVFWQLLTRKQMLRRSWLEWQPQKNIKIIVFQSFWSYIKWYFLQRRKIFFPTSFIWHQHIFHCPLIFPALPSKQIYNKALNKVNLSFCSPGGYKHNWCFSFFSK